MAERPQEYRKKQALLVLLVFVCLGVAVFAGSALVAVGAILAACGLCLWASTLEPVKRRSEHHH